MKPKLSNELDAVRNSAPEMPQIHPNTEQPLQWIFTQQASTATSLGNTSGDGKMRDVYILKLVVTIIYVKGLLRLEGHQKLFRPLMSYGSASGKRRQKTDPVGFLPRGGGGHWVLIV